MAYLVHQSEALSFGVAPTPTTNSFATLENLREDGASERVASTPLPVAHPTSSSSKVAMSIHELSTPRPKPKPKQKNTNKAYN